MHWYEIFPHILQIWWSSVKILWLNRSNSQSVCLSKDNNLCLSSNVANIQKSCYFVIVLILFKHKHIGLRSTTFKSFSTPRLCFKHLSQSVSKTSFNYDKKWKCSCNSSTWPSKYLFSCFFTKHRRSTKGLRVHSPLNCCCVCSLTQPRLRLMWTQAQQTSVCGEGWRSTDTVSDVHLPYCSPGKIKGRVDDNTLCRVWGGPIGHWISRRGCDWAGGCCQ